MRFVPPLLFALAASLLGCDSLWGRANRDRSTSDVHAIHSVAGIPADSLRRESIGTTRDIECRLHADATTVRRIVSALALTPVDRHEAGGLGAFVWQRAPGDVAASWASDDFAISGRPAVLRLDGGGAFEYLLLFHSPDSADVRHLLSYSYG